MMSSSGSVAGSLRPRQHLFPAKLTKKVAEEIRRLHRGGVGVKELARRYGVAKSSVSAILHLHIYVPEHVVMVPLTAFERALLAEIARDENVADEQLASERLSAMLLRAPTT